MLTFSIILGLSFFTLTAMIAVAHGTRVGRVTFLDWTVLAMGGVYGLGWVLILITLQSQWGPLAEWIHQSRHILPLHTIAATLLLAGVLSGWYLAPFRLISNLSSARNEPVAHLLQRWRLFAWSLLMLAAVFQWIYTTALGGPIQALEYSRLIRAGFVVENPWSFLKPLGGFAMISAFAFFGLIVSGERRIVTYLGGLLAFSLSLFVLYSWAGRMGFVVFVTTFALSMLLVKRQNPLRAIIWGGSMVALGLTLAYGISIWLEIKPAENLVVFLSRELMFPFASFFAHWSEGVSQFRWLLDFLVSPIFLLPSSIWGPWFVTAGEVNTILIMGLPKGVDGQTAAIPTDLVTLGFLQLHVVGIVLVGGVFGAILRGLQHLIDRIALAGVRSVFEAYVALKIAVLGVFYAQPDLLISGNFALIAAAVWFFVLRIVGRFRFGVSAIERVR